MLVVSFSFAGPALAPAALDWLPYNVGVLAVGVKASANLTSADGQSPPANSSVVVTLGSWGDAVVNATATVRSPTSVEVAAAPPQTWYQGGASGGWTMVVVWGLVSDVVEDSSARLWRLQAVVRELDACAASGNSTVSADDAVAVTATGAAAVLSTSRQGCGFAAVTSSASPLSPLSVVITGIVPGSAYRFDVSSAAGSDALNPYVSASPGTVVTQTPTITGVVFPGTALRTSGGTTLTISGTQLGTPKSVVVATLTSPTGHTLTSSRCTVVTTNVVVECGAPPGVGTGYALSLLIDGVNSTAYTNATLSYSGPNVRAVDLPEQTGADTGGGEDVVITGDGFGPAARSADNLGDVTYASPLLGVRYSAGGCVVTVDDVEIRCRLAPGVGARLLWTVVVAGQSSTNPSTSYHAPVLSGLAVVLQASGGAGADTGDELWQLSTAGGDTLVFTGRYFGVPGLGVSVVATGRCGGSCPGACSCGTLVLGI